MATTADYLQAAANCLQMQISNCSGGRMNSAPAHMQGVESGIVAALKAAEQAAPSNGIIFQAVNFMERLQQAPGNPVRNAARVNPGMSYEGSLSNYLTDLRTALNFVQQAQQHSANQATASPTTTPTNRASWTMQDWQANDSEGLAAMIKANTPQFRLLYKQAYGTDYQASGSHNKAR